MVLSHPFPFSDELFAQQCLNQKERKMLVVPKKKIGMQVMTRQTERERKLELEWPIQEVRFASFHIIFHSWAIFLFQILTIRHPPQDQDLSAIQAIKWLAVLAAHLQLQGLAAHLFLPLAHRRQAGGHELPAVCQTNGER